MTKQTNGMCAERRLRSASSLCTQWEAKEPNFRHVDSEDSDQTGRFVGFVMRRLIYSYMGHTLAVPTNV